MRYEDIRHDLIEAFLRHVEKHEDPLDDIVELVLNNSTIQKLWGRVSTPQEWADVGAVAFLVYNLAPPISWGPRLRDDWRRNPELCGICKAGRSHVVTAYGGVPAGLGAFLADVKPADPDVVRHVAAVSEVVTVLGTKSHDAYLSREPAPVLVDFDELTEPSEVVRQHVEAQVATATGIPKDEAKFIAEDGRAS